MKILSGIALGASLLAVAGAAQARDGETVYNASCVACHAAGVAGAPKTGDAAAWAPRVAKGIDSMLATAKKGINAMPPMGTCMDCSDEELKASIEFMLSKNQ